MTRCLSGGPEPGRGALPARCLGRAPEKGGTEENVPRASKGPLSMDAFENCSGARL